MGLRKSKEGKVRGMGSTEKYSDFPRASRRRLKKRAKYEKRIGLGALDIR